MLNSLLILSQLNDTDVDLLSQVGERRTLPAGSILIEEGQPISELFILLDGEVNVIVQGIGIIAHLPTGEVIGEMSLIDRNPPSASVIARSDSTVLAISKAWIESRLSLDAGFSSRFFKAMSIILSERLRITVKKLGSIYDERPLFSNEALRSALDPAANNQMHLA